MGREQSEKLNTSPSRGSGYQVINDLFDRQQDFIVVGLCGKTGSGVSTTAEILNKEFEELHLNAEPPAAGTDYERHEYRLLYNYAKKNWNCFYLVKTRALITARVLGKTADEFTQFLCELVNADKSGKAEESKNTIKQIVENELYNAKMTFEINTQFKRTEKDFPNTGIKTDEFFGIGKNPLDDYDAILLNPKAEREERSIVDLTSLQGNSYKVDLTGAEESGEHTAIYIHVEDATSGRISITNHDLYSLFHYYQRSRERKKGNINSLYYWILEEYIYHFLPEQTRKFWEKMSEKVPDFDKKETVAMQLLGNNLRISNEPLDKDQDGKYYNLKEDAYVTIARDLNHSIKILRAYMTKKAELASRGAESADEKVHIRALAVIDSIKNPFESMYLKQRYSNYYLMGVYTDEKQRQERLLNNKKIAVEDIRAIDRVEQLKKFKKEYDDYKNKISQNKTNNGEPHTGEESKILPRLFQRILDQKLEQVLPFIIQNVSSCLESADIFINNSKDNSAHLNLKCTLVRYISLMMYPGLVLPTRLEHCMQVAYASKANSGCISRQVGAVVTDNEYEILSLGGNQQPREQLPCLYRDVCELHALYDPDGYSDYENADEGKDSFQKAVEPLAEEYNREDCTLKACGRGACYCFKDLYNKIKNEKNQVHTRALHAEETAFLNLSGDDKSRAKGGYLFTTSSPCVLCAKKARYLNISKIYYVDPYPDISYDHVLCAGPRASRPEFVLFTGAIGTAYTRLFTPLLAIKDERELWIGHKIGETESGKKPQKEENQQNGKESDEESAGEHT